jgi:hypothetical protein
VAQIGEGVLIRHHNGEIPTAHKAQIKVAIAARAPSNAFYNNTFVSEKIPQLGEQQSHNVAVEEPATEFST